MPASQTPAQERTGTRCGYCAIAGRPNVGKSTLFNRLLGIHLSPVTHKRQTTRHNIRGILSDKRTQAIFIDTPGMHNRQRHRLNALLRENARHALHDADVLLFMVVASEYTEEDRQLLQLIKRHDKPCLLLINKIDCLHDKTSLLEEMREWSKRHSFHALLPLSARSDKNFSSLRKTLSSCLPHAEFLFSERQLYDRPQRFVAAELIREQLMAGLNQELPYAIHVEIEHFEQVGKLVRIEALVMVERETQKGIVLGARGEQIKRISKRARGRLQRFLQSQVYLSLRVDVRRNWQSDPAIAGSYLGA